MRLTDVVIVGAGPAGLRAAERLASAGIDTLIVHEGVSGGGNIYRRQPANFSRSAKALYGSEAAKADAIHALYDQFSEEGKVLPQTTVLGFEQSELLCAGVDGAFRLPARDVIIATGAVDRVLPIPGWTLPGVYALGGSQIALKHQACAIGRAVLFVGTGPLLYLVAWQYLHAGARVVGVLDTTSWWQKARQAPGMLLNARALALGLRYRQDLRRHSIALYEGIRPEEIHGENEVRSFRFLDARGRRHELACDAIGIGFGVKPETQLAELAGARLEFNAHQRIWQVSDDGHGRIVPGVYGAGDGMAVAGADAAEAAGHLAALAILSDRGVSVGALEHLRVRVRLARQRMFRQVLDKAFPVPELLVDSLADETILCRCEVVTVGAARDAIRRHDPPEINRLKALCRVGMGRCQGRMCGAAAAELLSACSGRDIRQVGRFRGQAPQKPMSYGAAARLAAPEIRDAIRASFREEQQV